MIKGRRVVEVNRYLRGSLGIYKNEYIYEYSDILREWVGYPKKWYELRTK